MTIADYFATPEAERILLVDFLQNGGNDTRYYLSDAPYTAESSDSPANVRFGPVIIDGGLPELRRSLNEYWDGGNASTSYGNINLSSSVSASYSGTAGSGVESVSPVRGLAIQLRMAAPRKLFPLSDAFVLATGKIGKTYGSSDGSIGLEVLDYTADIADKVIAIDTTVGPRCWGMCRNVAPFLIDPATLKYAVNAGAIQDVTAVYDQGALLTYPGQYTKNLSAGTFTLTASPVGVVTADVQGAKPSGTWLQSTADVMSDVLSLGGVTITKDFSALPTGLIGLYVTQSTTVGSLLGQLVKGCCGYWAINRTGTLVAAQYPSPGSAGTAYTETTILEEVSYEDLDRIYFHFNYSYRKNWTVYQARAAATAAQATFASSPGMTGSVNAGAVGRFLTGSPISVKDSPVVDTLFDSNTDASNTALYIGNIYGYPRKFLNVVVPYSTLLDLGSNVSLSVFGTPYNGSVVAISDVLDGTYPRLKLKVMA